MRVTIDGWSPEYGPALLGEDDRLPGPDRVDLDVEVDAGRWVPIRPDGHPATQVCFVDGVRRLDARVWLTQGSTTRMGLCASYAAGIVRCTSGDGAGTPTSPSGGAQVERCEVRRGLFAPAGAPPLDAGAARYEPRAVGSDDLDSLVQGIQQRLGELEIEVATHAGGCDLVVVDGPLSGRQNVPGAIGYVKSHHVNYLPEQVAGVVERLGAGERTPLFVTQTSWSRFSWYLRLPNAPAGHPWAGIVRAEATADLPVDAIRERADLSALTLPRFASQPHKDGRAPQNLYPIAGLERHLRRRLGDHRVLYRRLRQAS